LGKSPRTKLFGPPLDIEREKLNILRLRRLAKAMGLTVELEDYLARKSKYDHDPDVQANTSIQA